MAPLVLRVQRCLNGCRFFSPQSTVVVAVSTGVDSMALLTALQKLLPPKQIVVAHVNHHLRAQSQVEEQFLRKYCANNHLRLLVDEWVKHPESGMEASARQERYRFFQQVLHDYDAHVLLLAHQQDELVETMMMQLLRGGQIEQLLGIREQRLFDNGQSMILRPFLGVSKQTLIDFAQHNHVTWYEDITNHEDETLRNRFRNHYIPALMAENPRFKDHCVAYRRQLADLISVRDEYLRSLWDQVVVNDQLQLRTWQTFSTPTQRAILEKWLEQQGLLQLNQELLGNLQTWLLNSEKPSGNLQINSQLQVIKNYSVAKIGNVPKLPTNHELFTETVVKFDQWKRLNGEIECLVSKHRLHNGLAPVAEMWLHEDQLPLKWRVQQAHDQLRLKNGGHQSVRRLLINSKLASNQRQQVVVLADAFGQVLWVPTLKTSWLDRTPFANQPAVVTYLYRRKRKSK